MIPKIIHYCWYGPKPIPSDHLEYIQGWRRLSQGWTLQKWDESNSPLHIPYLKKALENNKFANASNFTRLYAVCQQGGIYLDTDVQMLRNFSDFLNEQAFFAFNDIAADSINTSSVNNAVFGACPGHPFVKELLDKLLAECDGLEPADVSSPRLVTGALLERGLRNHAQSPHRTIHIGDITVFHAGYFYPYSYLGKFRPQCIQKDTYAVHHWAESWVPRPTLLKRCQRWRRLLKNRMTKFRWTRKS